MFTKFITATVVVAAFTTQMAYSSTTTTSTTSGTSSVAEAREGLAGREELNRHQVRLLTLIGAQTSAHGSTTPPLSATKKEARRGDNELLAAVMDGRVNDIDEVLTRYNRTVDTVVAEHGPLIHLASKIGSVEVVQRLIELKAMVNAFRRGGSIALHEAVENGHLDVVRLLADNNADISCKTLDGNTALALARTKGHAGIVERLEHAEAEAKAEAKAKS